MKERSQIRKIVRARRNALSNVEQLQMGIALKERLSANKKLQQATRVAIYLSNDGELSTAQFIDWCWQQQKEVYLPVVHPFSPGNLLFLRYKKDTELVSNVYGILEPKLDVASVCPLAALDVICTPLVAFDKSGARLGMGGGYYDRSLAKWQETKLYPIGLAHDCQLVEQVPTESWDIPLPEIVTPSENFLF